MTSVGISEMTGEPITGWDRTIQGLMICVKTEVNERVQRRDFGGKSESLVDKPGNVDQLTNVFVMLQNAIEPRLVDGVWYGEPCFGLTMLRADLSTPGKPRIVITGVHYPNGHLNDFTTQEGPVNVTIPLEDLL